MLESDKLIWVKSCDVFEDFKITKKLSLRNRKLKKVEENFEVFFPKAMEVENIYFSFYYQYIQDNKIKPSIWFDIDRDRPLFDDPVTGLFKVTFIKINTRLIKPRSWKKLN